MPRLRRGSARRRLCRLRRGAVLARCLAVFGGHRLPRDLAPGRRWVWLVRGGLEPRDTVHPPTEGVSRSVIVIRVDIRPQSRSLADFQRRSVVCCQWRARRRTHAFAALPQQPKQRSRLGIRSAIGPDRTGREAEDPVGVIYSRRAGQRDRGGGIPRGKSGHRRARRWVTPTRGNPRESATETTQPMAPPRVAHRQW
jgi:hypothetical protein